MSFTVYFHSVFFLNLDRNLSLCFKYIERETVRCNSQDSETLFKDNNKQWHANYFFSCAINTIIIVKSFNQKPVSK